MDILIPQLSGIHFLFGYVTTVGSGSLFFLLPAVCIERMNKVGSYLDVAATGSNR
jgi:hypothetical protein